MLKTTMLRIFVLGTVLSATWTLAQGTPDIPSEKVVIVQLSEPADAGIAQAAPPPQPTPEPVAPAYIPPSRQDAPTAPPADRTLEALPPPLPLPEQLDPNPPQIVPEGPGAMLDGHPREGAFLSGPGSVTFLMHHTLMTGLGVLATQMVPRAIDAAPAFPASLDRNMKIDVPGGGCTVDASGKPTNMMYKTSGADGKAVETCSEIVTGEGARLAYLTGTLVGAAVGFTSAAIWQFYNWTGHRSANFGIITSFFGGMLLGGFTDLVTGHGDAYATTWMTLAGSSAGAWLATIVGGGDIAFNKAALIVSGGAWAAIYAALIVAIVATTGGGITARNGIDGVMIMPAIGAGLMALATLKFNPSVGQIMRANLFGTAVGGVVLLLSGLLLGPTTGFTKSPVPYILAGVGAIGAKTLVSLLWADAADTSSAGGSASDGKYRNVWW